VLPHEMNKNRKFLPEIGKIRLYNLANWMVRFCLFRQQSGMPPALNDEASPPDKRCLNGRYARIMTTQGVMVVDT
jgi:hypothetical protein